MISLELFLDAFHLTSVHKPTFCLLSSCCIIVRLVLLGANLVLQYDLSLLFGGYLFKIQVKDQANDLCDVVVSKESKLYMSSLTCTGKVANRLNDARQTVLYGSAPPPPPIIGCHRLVSAVNCQLYIFNVASLLEL